MNSRGDVTDDLEIKRSTGPVVSGPMSMRPRQAALKRFTLFRELPFELCCQIWELICCQPRCLDVWVTRPDEVDRFVYRNRFESPGRLVEFRSHYYKPPPILHMSREAREIGLNNYSLEFGSENLENLGRAQFYLSIPSRIYVN
jgi:hypothetical protein